MKYSSQSHFPSVMQCPLHYLHFTLVCIPPTVQSEYAENATPLVCMIYQTVDKVSQLILLRGISILHIMTFILILTDIQWSLTSNLTLPIVVFFFFLSLAYKEANMPFIMSSGRGMAIAALYVTMSKVRRLWGGWEADETLESMEILLLKTAVCGEDRGKWK